MQSSQKQNPHQKPKKPTKQQQMIHASELNNRQNVELLYAALIETGMHRTHLSATPSTSYNFIYKPDGKLHSDLAL